VILARARYLRALARAAGPGPIARAALLRLGRGRAVLAARSSTAAERELAAAALGGAPALFPPAHEVRAIHRLALPGAVARARARAEAILDGRVEVFGVAADPFDWHRDPIGGGRFDPSLPSDELDLLEPGPDPKGPWELARAAHLVELGAAARLDGALLPAARARVWETIQRFLDDNPLGRGLHWAAPLEAALRALNWRAALELTGGLADAPWPLRRRLGGALLEHARFVAANLEDRGVVQGNHLLGELAGLRAISGALGGAGEADGFRALAERRLPIAARAQVLGDGASFEGATGYHRFVLEILLAADLAARAERRPMALGGLMAPMFRFVRGYLDPAGDEPGFGDGDEGRVLPLTARPPRRHDYLLAVGAARLGDPSLKPPGARFSEEAAWLTGAAGYRRWRALPATPGAPLSTFPDGGVHVARDGAGGFLAFRCGGHGQRGVGGHSHNDQLSLVAMLDGEPLLIDPGTHCYAADPLWRDRFRATAAHSTLLVDGEEQAPLFDGRPFALPERASARIMALEQLGGAVRLAGRRGRHRREVWLDGDAGALAIVDRVAGEGRAQVEARLQLGELSARAANGDGAAVIERLDGRWGRLDPAGALVLERRGRAVALLAPLAGSGPPQVERGWWAPRYGARRRSTVVRLGGARALPVTLGAVLARL
jgi:hypothetical protein